MSAGSERDIDGPEGASSGAPGRLLNKRFVGAAVLALGVVALAGYWTMRGSGFDSTSAAPSASQASGASRTTELTDEAATKVLAGALARRPVVARLALGDVVTVDRNGEAVPLYPALAQAQIVRLRFCRFPGTGASADQICLADLTDKAKPYVYNGTRPFRSIAVDSGDLHPANRSFAQLIIAVPRLDRIGAITDGRRGEKVIRYTAHYEPTPLASSFSVSGDALPQSVVGTAEAGNGPSGWTIENDGLQQTEAKVN